MDDVALNTVSHAKGQEQKMDRDGGFPHKVVDCGTEGDILCTYQNTRRKKRQIGEMKGHVP